MPAKQQIADYISQSTRNRLVFSHAPIDGLVYVNVGKALAEALSRENLRSSVVVYAAEDYLTEIISSENSDPIIGEYLALSNIGILFEPSLCFNLKSILDNASKNKTVIISSEGVIDTDRFFFMQKSDNEFIDLEGLSFIEIK